MDIRSEKAAADLKEVEKRVREQIAGEENRNGGGDGKSVARQ
jgi:hypothetical protein